MFSSVNNKLIYFVLKFQNAASEENRHIVYIMLLNVHNCLHLYLSKQMTMTIYSLVLKVYGIIFYTQHILSYHYVSGLHSEGSCKGTIVGCH